MITHLLRGLAACVLLSAAVGCSSIGKFAGNQSAKAKIYVLRHSSLRGGGAIVISDNGKSVGTIHRGGIVTWERQPGTLEITASGTTMAKITLVVQANGVYYVEAKATHGTKQHPKEVELHILSQ